MNVPFGKPIIGAEEETAILDVLRSGVFVHGKRAEDFERAFAAFTSAPRAVSVGSCTAGLHLAYLAQNIGVGDEVLVPAQTHVATTHAVEYVGARPVFVDAEPQTGNIDLHAIESKITERTKALSVVHFLGMPVAMDRIMEIARRHNLFVVEDCALAIGAKYQGVHAGLFGDVGCFSFYPVKHMTTGEGGMVIGRDAALLERMARQKAFGLDRTVTERAIPGVYDVTMLGYNYRMNEMAAALGIEQLKRVNGFLAVRKQNYIYLARALQAISGISLLQSSHGDFESSYYCLSVLLDGAYASRRFDIVQYMKERGIGTSVYYPQAVPMMRYYREKYGYRQGEFPMAERISSHSIALTVGPHVREADLDTVARTLSDALAHVRQNVSVGMPSQGVSAPASKEPAHALSGKRIVLIGGAGFIGHNLALQLKTMGADVHVLDGLEVNNLLSTIAGSVADPHRTRSLEFLLSRISLLRDAAIPMHVIDARDYHKLSLALGEIRPHAIIHLAAVAHANRSNKDPYSTFDHSLRTLENALDTSKRTLPHFIYFSSSMVYGNFPAGAVHEEIVCEPLGVYGALKYAGEKMVIAYHQVCELPYTIIRPSALYGPRCISRRVGQQFIENALRGEEIVISGDGSDRLDFTYIDDLVHGVIQVLLHEEARGETFNVTYGDARSIGQMAEILKSHFPHVRVRHEPKDTLMPDRGTLSVEKAKRLIGYRPQNPLEVGYVKYIEWYKQMTDSKMVHYAYDRGRPTMFL